VRSTQAQITTVAAAVQAVVVLKVDQAVLGQPTKATRVVAERGRKVALMMTTKAAAEAAARVLRVLTELLAGQIHQAVMAATVLHHQLLAQV
jgi:hypothetical protein